MKNKFLISFVFINALSVNSLFADETNTTVNTTNSSEELSSSVPLQSNEEQGVSVCVNSFKKFTEQNASLESVIHFGANNYVYNGEFCEANISIGVISENSATRNVFVYRGSSDSPFSFATAKDITHEKNTTSLTQCLDDYDIYKQNLEHLNKGHPDNGFILITNRNDVQLVNGKCTVSVAKNTSRRLVLDHQITVRWHPGTPPNEFPSGGSLFRAF